jgi:pseudouridylate synthase
VRLYQFGYARSAVQIYAGEMSSLTGLQVPPTLAKAIADRRPVVALESAVITHGLPKAAALEAVERQWRSCEKAGTVPAIVAVFEGELRVGLSLEDCAALAAQPGAVKVSPWNLAASLARPGFGGTTVAATILAAAAAGIAVVSTGGIGGVHPGDGQDVSADLTELGRRPVAVVCAGPKSTLDAGATLERLETLGVPVIGWRSWLLAGFLATSAGLRLPVRAETVDELAALIRRHWQLGGTGVVVSQALPGHLAIPSSELAAADTGPERGPDRTPAELARLQARLGGRVIEANTSLLERNAGLAAALATALARHG